MTAMRHPVKPCVLDPLELVFTPKHGSWLNVSGLELSVLTRQSLKEGEAVAR